MYFVITIDVFDVKKSIKGSVSRAVFFSTRDQLYGSD
jgi:hypothetical protein